MTSHIEAIARAVKDLSYGELSMTQATDIATLAFSMSAEIFAERIKDERDSIPDEYMMGRAAYAECIDAIRALVKEG